MVAALASAGVTVLMTSELEDRYTDLRFSPYGTAFLTDAIIVQRYIEVDSRLQRVMAVVKVRGERPFGRAAPVQHRRRRHPHRRDAADQEGLLGGRPTQQVSPSFRSTGADMADAVGRQAEPWTVARPDESRAAKAARELAAVAASRSSERVRS